MAVDEPGEFPLGVLPLMGQDKKVPILSKHNPIQLTRSFEKLLVIPIGRSIFKRRQHVDAPIAEAACDGSVDVLIHVERDGHGRLPDSPSFLRTAEGPCADRIFSTS